MISLPPSASVIARDGLVASWDLSPIRRALDAGLIPVVFGDVVFDQLRGGTILSTEDLFAHLVVHLHPRRILFAGLEIGVWADFPTCNHLVEEITPDNLGSISSALGGSNSTDVTGGMQSKVLQSLELVKASPGLEVLIFSGEIPGNVTQALLGKQTGTRVHARSPESI
jgi:isopentenyl phosphate kinase